MFVFQRPFTRCPGFFLLDALPLCLATAPIFPDILHSIKFPINEGGRGFAVPPTRPLVFFFGVGCFLLFGQAAIHSWVSSSLSTNFLNDFLFSLCLVVSTSFFAAGNGFFPGRVRDRRSLVFGVCFLPGPPGPCFRVGFTRCFCWFLLGAASFGADGFLPTLVGGATSNMGFSPGLLHGSGPQCGGPQVPPRVSRRDLPPRGRETGLHWIEVPVFPPPGPLDPFFMVVAPGCVTTSLPPLSVFERPPGQSRPSARAFDEGRPVYLRPFLTPPADRCPWKRSSSPREKALLCSGPPTSTFRSATFWFGASPRRLVGPAVHRRDSFNWMKRFRAHVPLVTSGIGGWFDRRRPAFRPAPGGGCAHLPPVAPFSLGHCFAPDGVSASQSRACSLTIFQRPSPLR